MDDILLKICERREKDYQSQGKEFGCRVPLKRNRPIVPFLASPGAILEIKRSSPSKGMINEALDPVQRALSYREAGAKQISILTEHHFFNGSLKDLIEVGNVVDDVALLRKDFIQHVDEIDISYRAGADAVLLICAILDTKTLQKCADECMRLHIIPLIEVRNEDDIEKVNSLLCDTKIVGINSRDLSTFTINPLRPARLISLITGKAVYESGIVHPDMCIYARSLGFSGVLIGEAVSRDVSMAREYIQTCASASPSIQGEFWKKIAKKLTRIPLVKVCGITSLEDASHALTLQVDFMGFVFAPSTRRADESVVREFRDMINRIEREERPLLIGVITETQGEQYLIAERLYKMGALDALQYHGVKRVSGVNPPGYHAISLGSEDDVKQVLQLLMEGEPRVLIDGFQHGLRGGTGQIVATQYLERIAKESPLWLAGGLSGENVASFISSYPVEFVDASSSLESSPGKKNHELVNKFFQESRK